MPGQRIQLDERPLVQQRVDPLAGGELALGVHLLHRGLTDRVQRLLGAPAQIGQLARGGVDVDGVLGGGFRSVLGVLGAARHDRKCYRDRRCRRSAEPTDPFPGCCNEFAGRLKAHLNLETLVCYIVSSRMFQRLTHSKADADCQAHNGEPPPHSCVGNESDLYTRTRSAFSKPGLGRQPRACWPNCGGQHRRQLFCVLVNFR